MIFINLSTNTLRWRHNDHAGVSNHQSRDCLLNRLFRRRSKKTSKLRVTGLCAGNSPGTGELPAQRASYAENISIWWRHHELGDYVSCSVVHCANNHWMSSNKGETQGYDDNGPLGAICSVSPLTHWGRGTHICVSNLNTIGSDNGLSLGRRQGIIWTNGGQFLIGPLGTNFILSEIHTFSFKNMHLKLSSGKYRPSRLGLNLLIHILFYVVYMDHEPRSMHSPPWWQINFKLL